MVSFEGLQIGIVFLVLWVTCGLVVIGAVIDGGLSKGLFQRDSPSTITAVMVLTVVMGPFGLGFLVYVKFFDRSS